MDFGLDSYYRKLKDNRISAILNNRERTLKESTVTYRQLNSWGEQGLLTLPREGREWRRFSIIDALWVKVIQELRLFGLSLEQIKVAKESLAWKAEKYMVPMPLLEFYTAFAIGNKIPVVLLVFADGVAVPASFVQYKVAKDNVSLGHHIILDVNAMLQGFFPNVDLKPIAQKEPTLDVTEAELLAFLRIGNFEKGEITFKNGEMTLVEGMKRIDASKTLHDVMREHAYQKIEVTIDGGKKAVVIQRVKKQLKKKG